MFISATARIIPAVFEYIKQLFEVESYNFSAYNTLIIEGKRETSENENNKTHHII